MGLIALAIMVSLIAGASPLLYVSPLSPLIVGGAVVALVVGITLLCNPVLALYAAILVIFLPSARGQTPLAQLLDRMQAILNPSVTLIALVSWLLDVITQRRRIAWTSTTLLMLGFLIWGGVTLTWAPNLDYGLERLAQYVFRLLLFLLLVVNEINTKETLDGLMRVLAVNGWVLVLAGVGVLLFQGYVPGSRLRVLGMNQNEFGVMVLVTMPGVLWQVMQASERQKALRMAQSIVFLLLAFLLVGLSGSRGSAISLLATLLAFWFWKPTRPWGKLGLLILTAAVITAPFVFSIIIDRLFRAEVLEAGAGPLGGRWTIWQASWWIIRDHPWGGLGIGNASRVLASYVGSASSYFRGSVEMVSHNPILQIWIETGTPGMLLYLSVLVSAVWLFVRQYRQYNKASSSYCVSYFALTSCVFVGTMLSWIKGGGMEFAPAYFLLLVLLLIPSRLQADRVDCTTRNRIQDVAMTRL